MADRRSPSAGVEAQFARLLTPTPADGRRYCRRCVATGTIRSADPTAIYDRIPCPECDGTGYELRPAAEAPPES